MKAFVVGGPHEGLFLDADPNSPRLTVMDPNHEFNPIRLIRGRDDLALNEPVRTFDYDLIKIELGGGIFRYVYAPPGAKVKSKVGQFLAELWDECAEEND